MRKTSYFSSCSRRWSRKTFISTRRRADGSEHESGNSTKSMFHFCDMKRLWIISTFHNSTSWKFTMFWVSFNFSATIFPLSFFSSPPLSLIIQYAICLSFLYTLSPTYHALRRWYEDWKLHTLNFTAHASTWHEQHSICVESVHNLEAFVKVFSDKLLIESAASDSTNLTNCFHLLKWLSHEILSH